LPLRAAAIFPPLSSRTAAPRTTRSHNVVMKGRVPRTAVIRFASFETVQCSLFVLSCQEGPDASYQALEIAPFFDYVPRIPQAELTYRCRP
jgi:hypothetical protein